MSHIIRTPEHEHWMDLALDQASKAQLSGEVPVGAVLVVEGRFCSQGFNQTISRSDPTAHAEIMALRRAGKVLGNYRFPGSILYVTLEPCMMCAGALIQARVGRVVFGTRDTQLGAAGSVMNILESPLSNHRCAVTAGIRERSCGEILKDFFEKRR